MKTLRYLAYGSNLLPARLGARLGGIRALGRIALPGWELQFHKSGGDGSGKCDLVASPGGHAFGAIYEISVADRVRLDTIEGVGHGYRGTTIEITAIGQVYVYLAEDTHINPELQPFDWYHGFVVAGARHHGFPADYIAAIESITPTRDSDDERRGANLAILHGTPPP